jgi:effector-binding domain-containing protein
MRRLLLLALVLAPALAWGGQQFQPAPIGEVTIRTLPAYTVVEADETGSLEDVWTKGFRLGARYAAYADSSLNTPAFLNFPDWEKNPVATGRSVHVLVQIILDPLPNLPPARDPGAAIVQLPAMTVACCAHSGAYTSEHFRQCLDQIEGYLKAQKMVATGPPRYLYYTDTYWVPNLWRIGEVQVPVAPTSGGG